MPLIAVVQLSKLGNNAAPPCSGWQLSGNSGWLRDGAEGANASHMCAAFNDSDYGRKSLRERYVAMLAAAPQEVK